MEKFTANYVKTSRNFVIQNLKGDKQIYDSWNLNILSRDAEGFAEFAIEDILYG